VSSKRAHPAIRIKRVYDPPTVSDGRRFLAERLWPRGVKEAALRLDSWLRDVAPSTPLRQWFGHDPARWEEFQCRYRAELDAHPKEWQTILDAAEEGPITLLFSSRDIEHNNVVGLRSYLLARHAHAAPVPFVARS
jgi:uncharacterized protein YeaO (DUF488 family)